jgi:hypothetical protein
MLPPAPQAQSKGFTAQNIKQLSLQTIESPSYKSAEVADRYREV